MVSQILFMVVNLVFKMGMEFLDICKDLNLFFRISLKDQTVDLCTTITQQAPLSHFCQLLPLVAQHRMII